MKAARPIFRSAPGSSITSIPDSLKADIPIVSRKQRTVWNFDKPKKSELHPTTKPVPLVAYPIQNSSVVNSIVLEPFGGSGSTLIACEQTDRICYAVELDEKFVDVIVKRYIAFRESDSDVFLCRNGETIPYSEVSQDE